MRERRGNDLTFTLAVVVAGVKVVLFLAASAFVTYGQATRNLTPIQIEIEKQQERLSSGSEEDRRDALMRLGAIRRAAASRTALPGLSDASPMIRAVAAKAILSLEPAESAAALLPLLNDKDEFVRREVAYALGATRHRSATTRLSELLLNDKEAGVRGAAAVALGEIGDEAGVIALVGTLAPELSSPAKTKRKRELNDFVLRAAAVALGKIKSRAGTGALIAALSNEKFPADIRREAARSLGLIADPTAIQGLRSVALSEDPFLSQLAYEALRKINRGF